MWSKLISFMHALCSGKSETDSVQHLPNASSVAGPCAKAHQDSSLPWGAYREGGGQTSKTVTRVQLVKCYNEICKTLWWIESYERVKEEQTQAGKLGRQWMEKSFLIQWPIVLWAVNVNRRFLNRNWKGFPGGGNSTATSSTRCPSRAANSFVQQHHIRKPFVCFANEFEFMINIRIFLKKPLWQLHIGRD